MIDFFLSNNRIAVFLEQKKSSNHSKHVNEGLFEVLEAVISSASDQIAIFWLEIFCQHQIEHYFGR